MESRKDRCRRDEIVSGRAEADIVTKTGNQLVVPDARQQVAVATSGAVACT